MMRSNTEQAIPLDQINTEQDWKANNVISNISVHNQERVNKIKNKKKGLLRLKKWPDPSGRGSTFKTFLTWPSSLQNTITYTFWWLEIPEEKIN